MLRPVVAVVCLVSAGVIAIYTHYSRGSGEPVYTVTARAPDPVPAAPSTPPTAYRPIDPTDHAALARALQRELKRVGCYQGEITGAWTTSSRMAMKTFNERVNATLPVDNPDPVLLSLVQGHRDRACGAACPAGQTAVEGGACLPSAVAAKAVKTAPEVRPEADKPGDALPAAGAAAAGTAAAVALAATGKTDPGKTDPGKTDAKRPSPEAKTPPGAARPAAAGGPGALSAPTAPTGGPVPPEGMARDGKPRRTAEAPPPRPPKIVRDFLKALGFK
jgi:hypothetical protein